ncbi:LysM peptidoglycan-binding domain-containing protein [Mycobacterium angelicum]|uniref:Lectin n=1 Tax=Mycobacterium angelicum TaxID=470074 RepID=A0A1W9ZFK5_MYCAN|nr:LysM peptidoglycan-binding domain-containing protein [Mycobacterium angelicum]MCV7199572.1 LysM peptidoglycan-binding domain-containing protein [Mycobacterium angelicum]ORA14172.1 lectin [Mycobacterium angelicum]
MTDTLNEGQQLGRGESLTSCNGAFTVTLQEDGNLVLAARGEPRWASATNGQDVVRAEVQGDGNFVLYTPDNPVWHTDTKGKKNVRLVLQDDGNLVLYAADGTAAWASHTEGDVPPPPPAAEPANQDVTTNVAPEPVAEPAAEPVSGPAGDGSAAMAPGPAPEDTARTYTVEPGDTLWGIAERFYGDGSKYQVIADASGIANPDLIHPGQLLTIP